MCDGVDTRWQATTIANLLTKFMTFCQILDRADLFLTDDQALRARCAGRDTLLLYQRLAEDSYSRSERMWKLRPKMHYFMHIIESLPTTFENPARADAFAWEDFMGRIKRIAAKTHRRSASLRVVQRWLLLLSQRWHQRRCP